MENLSREQAAVLHDEIFNRLHTSRRGRGAIHSAGLFMVSHDPEVWGVGVSVDASVSDQTVLEGVPELQHDNVRIRHSGEVTAH